jgi:hypothetical protein
MRQYIVKVHFAYNVCIPFNRKENEKFVYLHDLSPFDFHTQGQRKKTAFIIHNDN